jgi:N-acetylneuraminate lyase
MRIKGLIAAAFTPMNSDGTVNYRAIRKIGEYYHSQPLAGIFINGTTGESMSLTVEERVKLANEWIRYKKEDFKIIVHVGHTSIEECKKLASHANRIGADAIGAMGPCFFRPTTVNGLADFCLQVSQASPDLPFYYYHMPSMINIPLKMVDLLAAISDKPFNFAGIKFTGEDLMDYRACMSVENGRFDILFGRDEILLAGLCVGAKGAIGSTYNYAAPLYKALIEAFQAGDIENARRYQDKSIALVRILRMTDAFELSVNKLLTRTPIGNLTMQQKSDIKTTLSEFKKDDGELLHNV